MDMNKPLQSIAVSFLLIFSCVLLSFEISNAQERGCTIEATKSAPGAGSFEFVFEGLTPGGPIEFTLADGESTGGPLPEGLSVTIFEAPQNGYRLAGLECESGPGIVITNFNGGFSIECVDASDGDATCVINNVPIVNPIPTLSEWGMLAAAAGLGLLGVAFALKKRKTQVGA
jgi:hypothetical protein